MHYTGYAVTKRELFRPLSIIHIVRIPIVFPIGVSIFPSKIYFSPCDEETFLLTSDVSAIFFKALLKVWKFDRLNPRLKKNFAFDLPYGCVPESRYLTNLFPGINALSLFGSFTRSILALTLIRG